MVKDDLKPLAAWSAEAFSSPDLELAWTEEKMLKHMSDDFSDQYSYVIEDTEGLIGGILAYPCEYDRGREIFLHTIMIKKEKQSTGLGKQFLQWFIQMAKDQGITGIRLDSHIKLPSFSWYQQFGFELTGWEQQLLKLD